jgi:uncharacterized damage-inducible protein DinB
MAKKKARAARKATRTPTAGKRRPRARPKPVRRRVPALSAKQQFFDVFTREQAITLKVMRAYPADQAGFQPHARSSTAKRLMWTFVLEQGLITAAIDGTLTMPPDYPPEPDTLAEVITTFERGSRDLLARIAGTPEPPLYRTVPFFTGPRQMSHMPAIELMWLMLMDSVHHRGQLSVYLRLAGGKVPSIYGPSADEPWT